MGSILDQYRNSAERVRLITIGHIEDRIPQSNKDSSSTSSSFGPNVLPIHVKHMEEGNVRGLLMTIFPELSLEKAAWVAQKSSGLPKVAYILAEAILNESQVSLATLDEKVLVKQYLERFLGDLERVFLEYVALFKRLGVEGHAAGHALAIAKFCDLSEPKMRAALKAAEDRGILIPLGQYKYITPEALRGWMAFNAVRQSTSTVVRLLKSIPVEWQPLSADRLAVLAEDGDTHAERIITELLGEPAVFGIPGALQNPSSARAFRRLARAAPKVAAEHLRTWISETSIAGLLAQAAGRREVVEVLTDALWTAETFESALNCLVRLSAAENDPGIANNATATLRSVFMMHLAPTTVDFARRLALADKIYQAGDVNVRRLMVRSVGAALKIDEYGLAIPHGRDLSQFSRPETAEARLEYRRAAVRFMVRAVESDSEVLRRAASSEIIESARGLIWDLLAPDVMPLLEQLVGSGQVAEVREVLEQVLSWDRELIPSDHLELVRRLYLSLPQDLLSRVKLAIGGWDHLGERRAELGLVAPPALESLAAEVLNAANRETVVRTIFDAGARNPAPLVIALGSIDEPLALWDTIVPLASAGPSAWLCSLYLSARIRTEPRPEALAAVESGLASRDPTLREISARVVGLIQPTAHLFMLLVRAIRERLIAPNWIASMATGQWTQNAPIDLFPNLFEALVVVPDGANIALDVVFAALQDNVRVPEDIVELVLAASLPGVGAHTWKWVETAKTIVVRRPVELGTMILSATRSETVPISMNGSLIQVYGMCLESAPKPLTRMLLDAILVGEKVHWRVLNLAHRSLADKVDLDAVLDWATVHGDPAQSVLGKMMPSQPHAATLKAFERFGGNSRFAQVLQLEFSAGFFWGERQAHYEQLASKAESWADDVSLPSGFRKWARAAANDQRAQAVEEGKHQLAQQRIDELERS